MTVDRCARCGSILAEQETIVVAESKMYCKDECGILDTGISNMDEWDTIKDVVRPEDIGL